MSLGWPGSTLEYSRKSWKKFGGNGKSRHLAAAPPPRFGKSGRRRQDGESNWFPRRFQKRAAAPKLPTQRVRQVGLTDLGRLKPSRPSKHASSMRGVMIFSIISVMTVNVGSTMKSMNPEELQLRILFQQTHFLFSHSLTWTPPLPLTNLGLGHHCGFAVTKRGKG